MARSNYGLGSLKKRGKIYHYKFYVNGEPVRGSTETSRLSDAVEFLKRKKAEHASASLILSRVGATIGELLKEFLRKHDPTTGGMLPSGVSADTFAVYKGHIEQHLIRVLGNVPLRTLTTDNLDDYRERRTAEKVGQYQGASKRVAKTPRRISQTTINRELTTLRRILKQAQVRDKHLVLPHFPMESEKNNARQGFITEEQLLGKLLPKLTPHLRAVTICAFYVGGRRGEWLDVRWSDVDLKANVIRLNGKNGLREAPILDGLMKETLEREKRLRDDLYPNVDAFVTYRGRPIKDFKTAWETSCRKAGLPDLIFHDMRRSANRYMREKNLPRDQRMQVMGHATAEMDRRYGVTDSVDLDLIRKTLSGKTSTPDK
jgi:integrase